MNNDKKTELALLLVAQGEVPLDDAAAQRLQELLRGDEDAQEFYVEQCQLHSMLAWEHGVLPEVAFPRLEPARVQDGDAHSMARLARRWQWLAIAATVLLLFTVGRRLFQQAPIQVAGPSIDDSALTESPVIAWESRDVYAVVAKSRGAELSVADVGLSLFAGDQVRSGHYDLSSGFVELKFKNDVKVIVEAPATFEVESMMRMVLHQGRLSAKVSPQGDGFTVETPTADVVDFGTEFAIEVLPDNSSEVHVFDGEVDVRPKLSNLNKDGVKLLTDRATRINKTGNIPEGIDIDHDRFVRDLSESGTRFGSSRRVIESLNPVTYLQLEASADGQVLENLGSVGTAGMVFYGQMISPPFAQGRLGQSLRLGGPESKAYAVVPDYPIADQGKLTVAAWVRAESRARWAAIAKNWSIEFEQKNQSGDVYFGDGGQFHFGLFEDDGDLEIQVLNADGEHVAVRENAPLPLGSWQHVAFVVDGETLRLYRNGQEVGRADCKGLNTICPKDLCIGAKLSPDGSKPDAKNPGYWQGRIDEFAIFHDALSAEQVREMYLSAQVHDPVN